MMHEMLHKFQTYSRIFEHFVSILTYISKTM